MSAWAEDRRVAVDRIDGLGVVSTVRLLGSAVEYETMLWCDDPQHELHQAAERYGTLAEAVEGHKHWTSDLRAKSEARALSEGRRVPIFSSKILNRKFFFAGYSVVDGSPLAIDAIDPEGSRPFEWPDDAELVIHIGPPGETR